MNSSLCVEWISACADLLHELRKYIKICDSYNFQALFINVIVFMSDGEPHNYTNIRLQSIEVQIVIFREILYEILYRYQTRVIIIFTFNNFISTGR